jgi:hypothetical protein
MTFDPEGHVIITPAEFQGRLDGAMGRLVNDILLVGTPAIFPTFAGYRDFLEQVADDLAVHSSSIVLRGSAKLGFSLTPRADKVWMEVSPESDVDLAVVDPDHFHFLDAEVRRWERTTSTFRGKDYARGIRLREDRAFYCYRHLDLPATDMVQRYDLAMNRASSEGPHCCGRTVSAFFYRDWWSVSSRCEYDLRQLRRGLAKGLPQGADTPRVRAS